MPERLPVSAFIITLNEAAALDNCLRSLHQCAEIVVVDSGSTDGTEQVVRRFETAGWPVRFIREAWRGYAAQKQFAMDQCTQPWRLNIDADERLDADFRKILPQLLEENVAGWAIERRNYLIGYGYTPKGVTERANLRLIRAGQGKYDLNQRVHEGIETDGRVKVAPRGSLLHYRPLPIDELILKLNKYSSLKADQIIAEGKSPRYSRLVLNPLFYFLRLYFRRRLFQCGFPGFIEAMTNAAYSFLSEAKIFQRHRLQQRPSRDDMDGEELPPGP